MKKLTARIEHLEGSFRTQTELSKTLTPDEREARWQALQRLAAQGDPGACWRVERINFFLERARARPQAARGQEGNRDEQSSE
jgi:hypothetical protein